MKPHSKPKLLFAHGPGVPESRLDPRCFQDFDIRQVGSFSAALRLLKEESFQLVLVDEDLPHGKALALCEHLRKRPEMPPVLIQTMRPEGQKLTEALQAGALDFITMPASSLELRARGRLATKARSTSRKVEKMVRSLTDRSERDPLTGLFQRDVAAKTASRLLKEGRPLHLIMLDIDFFKLINDTFGHLIGDSVLKELAMVLQQQLRKNDLIARYGGEEFLILISDCAEEEIGVIAEKLRRKVQNFPFSGPSGPISITISLGTSSYSPEKPVKQALRKFQFLLAKVDHALYEAKSRGRNRVWKDQA